MTETGFQLDNAPIVEAVLDIDCALPPALEIQSLEEAACAQFRGDYPKFRKQFVLQHSIKKPAEGPAEFAGSSAVQAFQFLTDDEKQIVQVRANGFAFNRLAPYGSLDDYLPEIKTRWEQFRTLADPARIRRISLRYVNRLLFPINNGMVKLSDNLKQAPKLPEETGLSFAGFLHQHQAIEEGTGNQVAIVLASQPEEAGALPIVLDIAASRDCRPDPENWEEIAVIIASLRDLKNRVFKNSLTTTCLNRY
jgi:uncharacterized protein (TIGR04255 family)